MKIIAWCTENNDRGLPTRVLATTIAMVGEPIPANAAAFKNGIGQVIVQIQNASADAKAELPAAAYYEVTITPCAAPAPVSAPAS